MVDAELIEKAKVHFAKIVIEQLERIERMKASEEWTDYSKLDTIRIGIVGGDGIGPYICGHARTVLETLLKDQIASRSLASSRKNPALSPATTFSGRFRY